MKITLTKKQAKTVIVATEAAIRDWYALKLAYCNGIRDLPLPTESATRIKSIEKEIEQINELRLAILKKIAAEEESR